MVKFFAALPPALIEIEACATAHHWARELASLGHEVRLMCLCPALVATPTVIATQPRARHAVAHLLHRVADRLGTPDRASPTRFASAPCLPGAIAGGLSAGLSAPLSMLKAAFFGIQPVPVPVADLGSSDVPGFTAFNPGGGGIGSSGGSGFGGGSGNGNGNGSAGMMPTPVAGVTESQNWALLITGFGATGVLLRARRAAAA